MGNIKSVLLVDDDDNIRLIASMSLEGLTDWQILQAPRAADALRLIDEGKPDLIILDMMMPDMDGVTALEEIKKRYSDAAPKVIFMTAKVQAQEIEKYVKLGALGVITKPFDPMKLPDQIAEILKTNEA